MMTRRQGLIFTLVCCASLGILWPGRSVCAQTGSLLATYTFPDIALGPYVEITLGLPPGSVDDHGIKLGGVGSGLWHAPSDGRDIFWMVTDRGANGLTSNRRTFPVPEFTPTILKVKVENGTISILESIPIKTTGGQGVTGLTNFLTSATPWSDESAWNCAATALLPATIAPNQNGLDTEDLVRTRDGNFWLVEEYRPSILKVAPDGTVLNRIVPSIVPPASAPLNSTDYPVSYSLPSIYGTKRKRNRGFEGLAISPNEKTLYAALQSPLQNPTAAVGNASRNTRILVFDVEAEQPAAEYVYRFDVPTVPSYGTTDPSEMKVSAIVALDPFRLLVLERTDAVARVYRVDIRSATNILGSRFDTEAVALADAIESETGFAASGVVALEKELVIDLSTIVEMPPKIEGLSVLNDGHTIAVSNDNDFGVGTFGGPACTLNDTGIKSQILVIKTDNPLK